MTATTGSGDTPRDDRETGDHDAPYGSTGGAADGPDAQGPATPSGSSPLTDHDLSSAPHADQDLSTTGEPYAQSPSAPMPSFAAGPAPVDRSEDGPDSDTTTVGPAFPAGEGARHPSPYGPPPTDDRTVAVERPQFSEPTRPAEEPLPSSRQFSANPADQSDPTVSDPTVSDPTVTGASPYPSSADTTATARYPALTKDRIDPPSEQGYGSAQDTRTMAIPGPADYAPSVPGHSPLVPAAAEPVVVPPPAGAPPLTGTGRDVGGRAVAAVISILLGALLVAGGLYLVGEFGSRIGPAMVQTGTTASVRDIILAIGGGALILVAVILNGWSPWATLLPGIALTGAGVWSLVSFDGGDRVAGFVNLFFDNGQLINWGITAWILVIGVTLLGASIAAIIARAAGRTRGRP